MINAIQRAKQKRSMADMKTIATALEAYATDQNFYPAAAALTLPSGLSLPTSNLTGDRRFPRARPTSGSLPLVDGWNSFYLYGTNAAKSDYAVRSAGADGAPDTSPAGGRDDEFQLRTSSSWTGLSCSIRSGAQQ